MPGDPPEWVNPLEKKAVLNVPVAEVTPVIWKDRLTLSECWRAQWDAAFGVLPYIQLRDVQSGEVLCRTFQGYSLGSAFVADDEFYLFASFREAEARPPWNDVWMSRSSDLGEWSEPARVIEQEPGEHCFNQSVCSDGERYVMAYEVDSGVPFSIKFATSDDLENWEKLPKAMFAPQRYAACPAIRFAGGYYYMLYAERPSDEWWFETWLARSRDLHEWELSPRNPVIAPNPDRELHPDCPEEGHECNASDPDLVQWQGKTRVYFTGGNQHWGGRLQYAEFEGPMRLFFESYF